MNKKIICHDIDGKKYKVDAGELKFRPSVYGVAFKNDQLLLVPQFDGHDFPGGGVDINETIEEALQREVWEETGLKCKPIDVIDCSSSFFKSKLNDEYWNCVLIFYLCEITDGKITTENFDDFEKTYAKKAQWIDVKEVKKIKFINSADNNKIIKKALKMARIKN